MKNKRLVIILVALAFLTVLIVINSTVFTLQNVSINWLTTTVKLDTLTDYDITNKLDRGGSIFLVNKQKIASRLEKEQSYLRVVSIETVFPNKLIIHSAERESLYAVRLPSLDGSTNYRYATVDELGRVLDFSSTTSFANNDGTKPIRVVFNGRMIKDEDFVKGEDVKNTYIKNLLTILGRTFRESSYAPKNAKGIFNMIEVVSNGEYSEINLLTRKGITIRLKKAEVYTTDKLILGLHEYNKYILDGVSSGIIEVWDDNSNKIWARLYEE